MSNPVVLIATHVRTQITSRTIEQLQRQSVIPHIILVCSLYQEYEYYSEKFDGVTVMISPNQPLGAKWSFGAKYAKHFNADPLIILGSDDLLGRDFIKNMCAQMDRGFDFIGVNRWWLINERDGKAYLMEYAKKDFPLGGARAYSARLLKKLDYVVFDSKKNRHLDEFGYYAAKASGFPYTIIQSADEHGLNIISIKGDWQTMNSADAILNAKSCVVVKEFQDGEEILKSLL